MIEATAAYAAVLAAIHSASFPPGEAWDAAAFAAQLGLPGAFALLDEAGGFVLARVAADEAEILMLAVAPGARRAGIGRRLVAAAMQAAAARGAAAMFLEVSASNTPAVRLYERAGFARVGLRRAYYQSGSDGLIMRAMLEKPGPVTPCGS
ncbi:MAG TPA: ribosomal protein S18-alanine N-acetyltransferase [Acidisphaera sp.]|nr:ribosomal protein S18-alanine N-acetyltransferase [Acidisphaera sp.]